MSENRVTGRLIDTHRLEESEPKIFLHRFVAAVRDARGAMGRYIFLRSGDEIALIAADDGSTELLEQITVVDEVLQEAE